MVLGEGKATCYAFALLSNHVHLLLRTGITPIAGIMSHLLTGYAVSFNGRHSDFVSEVIKAAGQTWERAHSLKKEGIDFSAVNEHVARLFNLNPEEILQVSEKILKER
jgi:hypothetical protein